MLYQPGNQSSVADYLSRSREFNYTLDDAADVEAETQWSNTSYGSYALQTVTPSELAAATNKDENAQTIKRCSTKQQILNCCSRSILQWPEVKADSTLTSNKIMALISDLFGRWGLPKKRISMEISSFQKDLKIFFTSSMCNTQRRLSIILTKMRPFNVSTEFSKKSSSSSWRSINGLYNRIKLAKR